MKGKWLLYFAVFCMALGTAALIAMAAEQKVPDTVTIQSTLWPQLTKGPVNFEHKKHSTEYKAACTDCHHKIEGGKNVWKEGDHVDKCQKCHTEPTVQPAEVKKLTDEQKKLNLQLAFHNNCQGCHKEFKKTHAESKAPTTACAGCHPKVEKAQ